MTADNQPEPHSMSLVELLAYVVTALCLVFATNILLDWIGRRLGSDIMEIGRRRDLGFVLSLGIGLFLTHKIAGWAGFRPGRRA